MAIPLVKLFVLTIVISALHISAEDPNDKASGSHVVIKQDAVSPALVRGVNEVENLLMDAINSDSTTKIKNLLVNYKHLNLSALNFGNTTLLNMAVKNENFRITVLLLEANVSPYQPDKNLNTALHVAAEKGNVLIVKSILEKDKTGVNRQNYQGSSALYIAAVENNTELFKVILESGGDPYTGTNSGMTCLHEGSFKGNAEIVKMILKKSTAGIDFRDKNGFIALHWSTILQKDYISILLVEGGSNPYISTTMPTMNDRTGLHFAARSGSSGVVESILRKNSSGINVQDKMKLTPLHLAVIFNHTGVCGELLEYNADPYVGDNMGFTALHASIKERNFILTKMIIRKNTTGINLRNNYGDTPLNTAVKSSEYQTVDFLLQNGANTKIVDNFGWSPLHTSVVIGNINITSILLENNTMLVNVRSYNGSTALYYAAYMGRHDFVEVLLGRDADPNIAEDEGWTPLHQAAAQGEATIVHLLTESNGTNVNSQSNLGETPLYLAASRNKYDVLNYLLNRGGNAEITDYRQRSLLHAAADTGDLPAVKLILNKTQLSAAMWDDAGITPLLLSMSNKDSSVFELLLTSIKENPFVSTPALLRKAVFTGNFGMVKMILNRFKDYVDIRDDWDYTPLHWALYYNHTDIMDYLLKNGADVLATNKLGYNVFHNAVKLKSLHYLEVFYNISKKLLDSESMDEFINHRDFMGGSPLSNAAWNGKEEAFKFLWNRGGNSCLYDYNGKSVLSNAAYSGSVGIMEHILNNSDLSVNSRSQVDYTPLMDAAYGGYMDSFRFLLERGARLLDETTASENLLHWAAIGGNEAILTTILNTTTIDINSRQMEGYTPLMYSAFYDNLDCVRKLLNSGADPLVRNVYGESAIEQASLGLSFGSLQLFSNFITDFDSVLGLVLTKRFTIRDQRILDYLLDRSSIAAHPLFRAAAKGDDITIRNLLSQKALSRSRSFPKIMAPFLKDYDNALVQMLSDESMPSYNGRLTPLDIALLFFGKLSTVKLLIYELKLIKKINYREKMWTSLDFAMFRGDLKITSFMLRVCNCSVSRFSNNLKWTALHKLAWMGRENIFSLLNKYGVNYDQPDVHGRTPLHVTALNGHFSIAAKILHRTTKSINKRDVHGFTPLHLLAIFHHRRFFSRLSTASSKLPAKEKRKLMNFGHEDEGYKYSMMATYLIDKGANVNLRDKAFGWTPLHWASANGNLWDVAFLTSRGAKVNVPSWEDETPMEIARKWGRRAVYNYLKNKGGVW